MKDQYTLKYNLIFTKDSISTVYKLEPIDLIILPESEQQIFIKDMQHMLASIQEGAVQIIMRTRKAIPDDFSKHFSSMQNVSAGNEQAMLTCRNRFQDLINQYIQQLSLLLEQNIIPVKEYFMVFQEKVSNQNAETIYCAVQRLERNISRIAANVAKTGIGIKQIEGEELNRLIASFTRIY